MLPVSAMLDRDICGVLSKYHPVPLTCHEIERELTRIHQAVSGNMTHLYEKGIIEESGLFGLTPSNRRAIKWRLRIVAPLSPLAQDLIRKGIL
jgi:hypothetical protein